jgi:hypothetical protein
MTKQTSREILDIMEYLEKTAKTAMAMRKLIPNQADYFNGKYDGCSQVFDAIRRYTGLRQGEPSQFG